ncbi:MAG TPA: LysR substrate-binding domain-containing protein [Blastocatellia bacterium]|nr:LysR substrate-binding domain-containing protein [Blastocatellia bacterium]
MKLDIRHLKLVVAVTEEKSVTRAGERLHLTQSALSHQLRDIEERLGTPLFLRMNKRMLLTQAGERLLVTARQVLDDLKRVEEDIARMASNKQGTLRISTECYTCYHWLPDLLKEFNRKFPGVEVQIILEATRQPIQALLDGKLDLAIVSRASRNNKLRYQPVFKDEVVAIMRPDHPLAARPYLRARDFADQHLFLYVPPKESDLFRLLLTPAGVTPAKVSQIQLTEAILEMVKAGLGVSMMARWAVKEQVESGQIVALPLTSKGLRRQWSAALLKNDYVAPYISEFIELLSRPAMPMAKPGIIRLVS